MATVAQVPFVASEDSASAIMTPEQYLTTAFRPDRDFVDGRAEERNVGEVEHSYVQKAILRIFMQNEERWNINALQQCRLQVAHNRYRIPDTMVLRADQKVRRIVYEAPYICIEVLSPKDTWRRLRTVLEDFLTMGVPHIWAFDPDTRSAYIFDAAGLHRAATPDLTIPGTDIRIPIADAFSLLPKE